MNQQMSAFEGGSKVKYGCDLTKVWYGPKYTTYNFNLRRGDVDAQVYRPNRQLKKKRKAKQKLERFFESIREQQYRDTIAHLYTQSGEGLFGSFGAVMSALRAAQNEFLIKLVEDVIFMLYWLVRARSKMDYVMAIANFVKMRHAKSLSSALKEGDLIRKFECIFEPSDDEYQVQSAEEVLASLRDMLDSYKTARSMPIIEKFYKFSMYALSFSMFESMGISLENLHYSEAEAAAVRSKYKVSEDFVLCILDTMLFMCERGWQCMKLGSLEPLMHSGTSYEKWYDKATELRRQSQFMGNPDALGINYFKYLGELDDTIEQGESIVKWNKFDQGENKNFVRRLLDDLKLTKAVEITRRAAQGDRAAPFGINLFGSSGIGKSFITKALFYQFAKTFDLPHTPEYRYVRNPVDEYWTNFKSFMWCVQLDDVAFVNPNKSPDVDSSLKEMLQLVNNVPFVPTQADLADKGKTPCTAKLVILTTNTKHLNATYYFSCPVAVQRRVPLVVTAFVKPQYAKDSGMLDSSKTENLVPGRWPDWWTFKVERVVETSDNRATFELIEEFDSLEKLNAYISRMAVIHDRIQKKVLAEDDLMGSVEICEQCYMTRSSCACPRVQSDETFDPTDPAFDAFYGARVETIWNRTINTMKRISVEEHNWSTALWRVWKPRFFAREIEWMWRCLVEYFLYYIVYIVGAWYLMKWVSVRLSLGFVQRFIIARIMNHISIPRIARMGLRLAGESMEAKLRRHSMMLKMATAIGVALVAYKASSLMMNQFIKPDTKVQDGETSKIGGRPEQRDEEREQVWYKDDYVTTPFDTGALTPSWKAMPKASLLKVVSENCVAFVTRVQTEKGLVRKINKAFCVNGHIYVTNNHGLPTCGDLDFEIIQGPGKEGVTNNVRMLLDQSCVARYPEKDLAFVRIDNIPPRKNLSGLFAKDSFKGAFNGTYVSKGYDGQIEQNEVRGILKTEKLPIVNHKLSGEFDLWMGKAERSTVDGECGSLLIGWAPAGPIALGIHVLGGYQTQVGALQITQKDIERGLHALGSLRGKVHVQSGVPMLSAEGKPRVVQGLDKKSTIRYISEGIANVYGSFAGFRARHKSSVKRTAVCDFMLKNGYTVKTGAPVMRGWQPWRLASVDMVQQKCLMRPHVLDNCVRAFTNEILQSLSKESLQELMILDNKVAINGLPGVTYLDKMNRSSSMGNPWKTSKKYYLIPDEDDEGIWDNPVTFTPEVIKRADEILSHYLNGERAMPNFCAHLKDEPLKFSKIEAGQTRVFTGCPADWALVNRKYLLTFVRLVQNNRYIFEAGPGTVAQSLEWQEMRQYLTKFGEDRIIAGDYGKFDRRMQAMMVLAAFQIIINVHRAAGWDETSLRVLQCIAEDTAFPLVDFNGDLIEFFGTNPSGHPLTVIINSLANSLYMRYAHYILSPEQNCENFKQSVALMTYGDDNTMGVSVNAPWFNHTSIQGVLADIGVKYTMADKDAESVPYIHIDEVSFLKRKWRWDEDVGAYLCPLEHDSIEKMLTMCTESKTICAEAQAVDVIASASREYWFYGKTVFEEKRELLARAIQECELTDFVKSSTLPTWEELYNQFWRASKRVKIDTEVQSGEILECDTLTVTAWEWEMLQGIIGWHRRIETCRVTMASQRILVFELICVDGQKYTIRRECAPNTHLPGRSPKSVFTDVRGWFTRVYEHVRGKGKPRICADFTCETK